MFQSRVQRIGDGAEEALHHGPPGVGINSWDGAQGAPLFSGVFKRVGPEGNGASGGYGAVVVGGYDVMLGE